MLSQFLVRGNRAVSEWALSKKEVRIMLFNSGPPEPDPLPSFIPGQFLLGTELIEVAVERPSGGDVPDSFFQRFGVDTLQQALVNMLTNPHMPLIYWVSNLVVATQFPCSLEWPL